MLRREHDEDLFKNSTMTFGEHLEELRSCLFKAIIGLVLGFIVGLFVGKPTVAIIKYPLVSALEDYVQAQSARKVQAKVDELQAAGKPIPGNPEEFARMIEQEHLLAEEIYVDPRQLFEHLKTAYPEQFQGVKVPADDPEATLNRNDLLAVTILRPIEDDRRVNPTTLSAQEAFSIYIKAAMLVGVILSSPWVFYQIWSFVAAGLYPHEKYYVHVFLPFSLGLFLVGAALAFFFVFEPVLDFLLSFNDWLGLDPEPRISEWLSFVLVLPIGFGVAFQLPLVMLFLERIGVVSVEAYLVKWRIAIMVIFVLSMILTPADPYSMMLMAVPLTFLYFGGVLLCMLMPKKRSPYSED